MPKPTSNASLTKYKIFGKNKKPTIYYFTGHGTTIMMLEPHIRLLKCFGFRVVAFEYKPSVLDGGEPQLLIDALDEILAVVKKDMTSRTVAGAYAISLGSFFAFNAIKLGKVNRIFFNASGANMVKAVWDVPVADHGKREFIAHGYNRESLQAIWGSYDLVPTIPTGSKVLLMVSKNDQSIPYAYVKENADGWQKNSDVKQITMVRSGHGQTIILGLLKILQTNKFFRG